MGPRLATGERGGGDGLRGGDQRRRTATTEAGHLQRRPAGESTGTVARIQGVAGETRLRQDSRTVGPLATPSTVGTLVYVFDVTAMDWCVGLARGGHENGHVRA